MVSLDQIQLLEQKIEIAVGKIVRITEENLSLHRDVQRLKTENESLQGIITKAQDEQIQIERGILSIIDRLEAIETTVLETVVLKAEQVPEQEELLVEDEPEELSVEEEPIPEAVSEPKSFVEDPVVEIDDFEIAPDPKPNAGDAFSSNSESDSGQLEIF
jgi:chromosome segregation ATPase